MRARESSARDTQATTGFWRGLSLLFLHVIACVGLAVFAAFLVAFFVHLNARISPGFPWFLLPVGITILVAWRSVFRAGKAEHNNAMVGRWGVFASIASIAFVGVVVLGLMSLQVRSGSDLRLPGDTFAAPPFFQFFASLVILTSAAFVEEIAVRGLLQYRLQSQMPVIASEMVADTVFVGLHFLRFHDPIEVALVVILSLLCGRAAAMTQSLSWPIAIHAVANLVSMTCVLAIRN
jgi:membrane protease YdiL (CAAX protease family)